jgi:hypothetical protein
MSDETKNDLPVETEESLDPMLGAASDLLLDQTIPAPLRRGIVQALNRLGGGVIDIPAGFLERRDTEKRAESEERIKFMRAVNAELIEQIKTDPEFTQRASNTYAMRILREQSNLEKVFRSAMDFLKKKKYDNSTDQQANSQAEETISPDWFNIYEKEASQKSTKDMQLRFAEVLAGEIEKPGSHSIKAVKALGDMDQTTADLFQKLCSVCIVLGVPVQEVIIDIRVPAIGGNAAQNSLSKYGLSFSQLNILNEYGLVISDYNSYRNYQLSIVDKNNKVLLPFRHQGRYWGLKSSTERAEGNKFEVNGVGLSNVGRELFHIIDQVPMPQYTQDLKEFFKKQNLQMLEAPAPVFVQHTP